MPAGVIVFFQALDENGLAVQTMRSVTHVQPGQTLGCIGCHEHRHQAPSTHPALASRREPSRLTVGLDGYWPLRFDRLVQPVLDRHCLRCHTPAATNAVAAQFDLRPDTAYETVIHFGQPCLRDQVRAAYQRGFSVPGDGIAHRSALWARLDGPQGHDDVVLDADARERMLTWLDTYAQRLGHFSDEQEQELIELRRAFAFLLTDRRAAQAVALDRPAPD